MQPNTDTTAEALKQYHRKNIEDFRIATASLRQAEREVARIGNQIVQLEKDHESILRARCADMDTAALSIVTLSGRKQLLEVQLKDAEAAKDFAAAAASQAANLMRAAINPRLFDLSGKMWEAVGQLRAVTGTVSALQLLGKLKALKELTDGAAGTPRLVADSVQYLDAFETAGSVLLEQIEEIQLATMNLESAKRVMDAAVAAAMASLEGRAM